MFKENLKRYRIEKNLMQKELAEMIGVSKGAISSWEMGRTEPNMGMVEKLAEALEVSKSELIGDGIGREKVGVILSGSEKMLIEISRQLENEDKTHLIAYAYKLLMEREG